MSPHVPLDPGHPTSDPQSSWRRGSGGAGRSGRDWAWKPPLCAFPVQINMTACQGRWLLIARDPPSAPSLTRWSPRFPPPRASPREAAFRPWWGGSPHHGLPYQLLPVKPLKPPGPGTHSPTRLGIRPRSELSAWAQPGAPCLPHSGLSSNVWLTPKCSVLMEPQPAGPLPCHCPVPLASTNLGTTACAVTTSLGSPSAREARQPWALGWYLLWAHQ